MKEYEIWMEGSSSNGQHDQAHLMGKAQGETFDDACKNFSYPEGGKLNLDGTYPYPSIWACRLYDNEKDARKHFG